jgi:hypothetical protein
MLGGRRLQLLAQTERKGDMSVFTIHFQEYPTPPGPSFGIKSLLARTSTDDVIILCGNPDGFEHDIQSIKDAGIGIDNQTGKAI